MMKTDTEIKMQGLEILYNHLGMVETERFVALIIENDLIIPNGGKIFFEV